MIFHLFGHWMHGMKVFISHSIFLLRDSANGMFGWLTNLLKDNTAQK